MNLYLHLHSTYTHVIHTPGLRCGFSRPFSCLIEHPVYEFVDLGSYLTQHKVYRVPHVR